MKKMTGKMAMAKAGLMAFGTMGTGSNCNGSRRWRRGNNQVYA